MNTRKITYITNDVNEINFKNLTEKEADLFLIILTKLKDKLDYEGELQITMSFKEIRDKLLIDRRRVSYEKFDKFLINSLNNIIATYSTLVDDNDDLLMFPIFESIRISRKNKQISFALNHNYINILNFEDGKYTKLYIDTFIKIKGIYTKRMYCVLKQFSKTGKRMILINDLKRMLDCDEYEYKYLKRDIIMPSIRKLESSKCFRKIDFFENKDEKGKVVSVVFNFKEKEKKSEQKEAEPIYRGLTLLDRIKMIDEFNATHTEKEKEEIMLDALLPF